MNQIRTGGGDWTGIHALSQALWSRGCTSLMEVKQIHLRWFPYGLRVSTNVPEVATPLDTALSAGPYWPCHLLNTWGAFPSNFIKPDHPHALCVTEFDPKCTHLSSTSWIPSFLSLCFRLSNSYSSCYFRHFLHCLPLLAWSRVQEDLLHLPLVRFLLQKEGLWGLPNPWPMAYVWSFPENPPKVPQFSLCPPTFRSQMF